MSLFEKISLWIVKIGLWILPFLPLYVSGSMLFPFITGKNFAFRIIIEIIFAFWAGLAVARHEYRPRLTPLFKIVTAFVAIVFLADLLSPHPYRSFFSNYERMEGFMMLGHMYLYFVMLVSVFRSRNDWMIFFHLSLAASIIACYYGLMQKLGRMVSLQGGFRVDSRLGNPTYFAAYLLFHIWFLAMLIYEYAKVWWRAALYGAVLVFELVMIYFTATRGVVLALALAVPPFLMVLAYFWPSIAGSSRGGWSMGRKIAAGLLVLSVAVPLVFWSVRKTDYVQHNAALQRLTNYSFSEGTIQDRFLIWKMSLKGVMERPILGWGQENYYLVFQKYYEPGLFGAEAWFDRSHNVFLDWAVHAGLPGLGAYLGILGIAIWQIVVAMRRDRSVFFTGLALLGLFATDFFQKLFVFDNFSSYLLFFAFLAYAEYISATHSPHPVSAVERRTHGIPYGAITATVFIVMVAIWGWWANIKPLRQSQALIRALQLVRANAGVKEVEAAFQDALAYRSFGDTETREQLGNLARTIAGNTAGSAEDRIRFTDFTLAELRKETNHPAADVKHVLFILSILIQALPLDQKYVVEANALAQEALKKSPTKQPVYFEVAQLHLAQNQVDRALELLHRAWQLAPQWRLPAGHVWTIAIFAGKADVIEEVKKVWTLNDFDEGALLGISRAYQQTEHLESAREVYAILVKKYPSNPQYHATYAALLAQAGMRQEARAHVEEAIRLNPAFEQEGKAFLQTL
ncbi:MAG: O-antigen ligase family protein [Patescibacteria group bacterium]